jgi:hypothetical protein
MCAYENMHKCQANHSTSKQSHGHLFTPTYQANICDGAVPSNCRSNSKILLSNNTMAKEWLAWLACVVARSILRRLNRMNQSTSTLLGLNPFNQHMKRGIGKRGRNSTRQI